jgi:hypothetical protein
MRNLASVLMVVLISQSLCAGNSVANTSCQEKKIADLIHDNSAIPDGTKITLGQSVQLGINSLRAELPVATGQFCVTGGGEISCANAKEYTNLTGWKISIVSKNRPEWVGRNIVIDAGTVLTSSHNFEKGGWLSSDHFNYTFTSNDGSQFQLPLGFASDAFVTESKDLLARLLLTGVVSQVCMPGDLKIN